MRASVPLASILTLGFTIGSLSPAPTHAQAAACRSDPVVSLSNLAQIDVQASIGDSISDVKSVQYVIHGPPGTSMLAVINTDTLIGLKESVKYYADDSKGVYDIYTTVTTGQGGVSVTAYDTVISALGLTLSAPSVTGKSGQTLHVHITPLL